MKISYSNYPILKQFKEGKLTEVPFLEEDLKEAYSDSFNNCVKSLFNELVNRKVNNDIIYISEPFLDAVVDNSDKILNLIEDIATNSIDDILINSVFIRKKAVHFLSYKLYKSDKNKDIRYLQLRNDGAIVCFLTSDSDTGKGFMWKSNGIKTNIEMSLLDFLIGQIQTCLATKYFQKFAQVETKYINSHKKEKGINCKYVNDTDFGITYLDSKWFTNLVKSEGFKVRGHFRFQPCGEGLKERKIIWISDFEKTGYTAKARIYSA